MNLDEFRKAMESDATVEKERHRRIAVAKITDSFMKGA